MYEPYPMGLGGGNLRTQLYIAKRLDRTKLVPVVITPDDTPFIERFRQAGVECLVETPPPSIHRFAGRVLRDSLLARARSVVDLVCYNLRLARLFRRRGVDVLYCNSIRAVLLSGLGGRLAGVPVVWYIKGALDNPFLDRLGFLLADRILFFCAANRDDRYPALVRRYRRKIGVVRIGLDTTVIDEVGRSDRRALAEELDIRPDRINAIMLGQVYRPKGQHYVLEGLKSVVDEFPNFMMYIAGDHVLEEYRPYRQELERIIERDGLQQHVRFIGWRTDALPILSLMDIMVHPSLAEGFGRAVLEAMALGRAVVASAVGGLREAIRDGENGFLVPSGDTAALTDRIRRLARDPALRARLGREARREVDTHYLIEDKVAELQQIWLEAAGR